MKIYCPKCHTCYEIEVGLIPADGKKLRCHRCGEVWTCTHADMTAQDSPLIEEEVTTTPTEDITTQTEESQASEEQATSEETKITPLDEEAPQNIIANEDGSVSTTPAPEQAEQSAEEKEAEAINKDMQVIFSRLKEENEKITTEKENLSPLKKFFPKIKRLLGWDSYLTISIEVLVILIIIGLSLFGNRFQIVRIFPQTEQIFSQAGIPSRVIGEGLEFQNIVRNNIKEGDQEKLNIKGFIYNTTEKELEIPIIAINVLNNNGVLLAQKTFLLDFQKIGAQEKIPFNFVIDKPVDEAKFIVLTFTEEKI